MQTQDTNNEEIIERLNEFGYTLQHNAYAKHNRSDYFENARLYIDTFAVYNCLEHSGTFNSFDEALRYFYTLVVKNRLGV